jgi:hypothetical protein
MLQVALLFYLLFTLPVRPVKLPDSETALNDGMSCNSTTLHLSWKRDQTNPSSGWILLLIYASASMCS